MKIKVKNKITKEVLVCKRKKVKWAFEGSAWPKMPNKNRLKPKKGGAHA